MLDILAFLVGKIGNLALFPQHGLVVVLDARGEKVDVRGDGLSGVGLGLAPVLGPLEVHDVVLRSPLDPACELPDFIVLRKMVTDSVR